MCRFTGVFWQMFREYFALDERAKNDLNYENTFYSLFLILGVLNSSRDPRPD